MVNNKSIGIAICSFYGVIALAFIAQILFNVLGQYNLSRPIWIVANIICCTSMAYIALNKSIKSSLPCQIGATILSALFAVYTVNLFLSYADIYFWDSLGEYVWIISHIIGLIAAFMLFYFIKAWMPVKIFAIVYWIPDLCSTCLNKIAFDMTFDMAEKTSDRSLVYELYNAAEICAYLEIALAILTVVFTLIWIKKKPTVAHIQSNPIDIL